MRLSLLVMTWVPTLMTTRFMGLSAWVPLSIGGLLSFGLFAQFFCTMECCIGSFLDQGIDVVIVHRVQCGTGGATLGSDPGHPVFRTKVGCIEQLDRPG